MPREEADALLEQVGASSQLPHIILAGYKSLGLIHYFTAGSDEVRAWTVRVRPIFSWSSNGGKVLVTMRLLDRTL